MRGAILVTLQGNKAYCARAIFWFYASVVAITFVNAQVANAIDLPTREASESAIKAEHVAVDGSTVVSSLGDRSFDLNGTFSPYGDINDSGLRFRVAGNASWYRFLTADNPRTFGTGHSVEGDLLAGYQISLRRISIIGLIGGAFGESRDQGVSRTSLGAKAVLSMYATPWEKTMAYSSLSYSTIANFLQFQTKGGVQLIGNFYTGPELGFSWRDVTPSFSNIAQARVGWHVSAMPFGPVHVGISGGWAHNRDLGSGYYGGLSFYGTF